MNKPQINSNKSIFYDINSLNSSFLCSFYKKHLNSNSSSQINLINSNENPIINSPNYILDDSILRQSNPQKEIYRDFIVQQITNYFLNSQISIDELNKFADLKFINSYTKNINKRFTQFNIENGSYNSFLTNSVNNDEKNLVNQTKARRHHAKFSKEEDEMITKLVSKLGDKNWRLISSLVPGKNQRQCRDRYKNYLAPNLIRSQWTQEEDDLLLEKYKIYGSKWSQIHQFLPNRTSNDIKNRYNYTLSKKAKNKISHEDDNDFFSQNHKNIMTPDLFYNDHFNFDNEEFQINDLF